MKTLVTIESHISREELESFINLEYIKPLKSLGFDLLGYQHLNDEPNTVGVHVMIFNREPSKSQIDFVKLEEILSSLNGDCGQPDSTYQLYLNTLWVFIPFNC